MENFGQDYFVEVIEEEYGIAPGSNDYIARQIDEHFERHVANFKLEQRRMEQFYESQVSTLERELAELEEQNARLIRNDQVFQDKALKELRQNQKVLARSHEEATIKAWKTKFNDAKDKIEQLVRQRDNEYRSQKSMQLNYAWKRWSMFTMMRKVISNVDEHKRTAIDMRVFKLCEKFVNEEFLILRYSNEHQVPPMLVKDLIHTEKKLKWKHRLEEMSDLYGQA